MRVKYAPGEDPEFDLVFQPWVTGDFTGQIRPEVWKSVILRPVVPVVVTTPTKTLHATASRGLTNFAWIRGITESAEALGLSPKHYADLKFRIDWQTLLPEEVRDRMDVDPDFASAWGSLSYEAACNLLKPLRRQKSPQSIGKEILALIKTVEHLYSKEGGPGSGRS